jgi:hypothetical protein
MPQVGLVMAGAQDANLASSGEADLGGLSEVSSDSIIYCQLTTVFSLSIDCSLEISQEGHSKRRE